MQRGGPRPRLILVCGVPGAGKTTLARGLSDVLHLPVVIRDAVKTGLAATRGTPAWEDQAGRDALGGDGFDLFHRVLALHLDARCSLVAEAAWHWSFALSELSPLWERSEATLVHVTVDPAMAAARYRARHEAGLRHASHHDDHFAPAMADPAYPWDRYLPPADLTVPILTVDGARPPADVLANTLARLS